MSSADIFNYLQIDERIATAGQPTEEQVRETAAEGFTAIINLAPVNPPYTPEDEAGLAQSLGLDYVHIPVDWNNPTDDDFAAFETAMKRLSADKVLIHCAANYRVTAFYSLYARRHLGWSEEQAQALRHRIWADDRHPVWDAFIARKTTEV